LVSNSKRFSGCRRALSFHQRSPVAVLLRNLPCGLTVIGGLLSRSLTVILRLLSRSLTVILRLLSRSLTVILRSRLRPTLTGGKKPSYDRNTHSRKCPCPGSISFKELHIELATGTGTARGPSSTPKTQHQSHHESHRRADDV